MRGSLLMGIAARFMLRTLTCCLLRNSTAILLGELMGRQMM